LLLSTPSSSPLYFIPLSYFIPLLDLVCHILLIIPLTRFSLSFLSTSSSLLSPHLPSYFLTIPLLPYTSSFSSSCSLFFSSCLLPLHLLIILFNLLSFLGLCLCGCPPFNF
jgi:hypothetical protein